MKMKRFSMLCLVLSLLAVGLVFGATVPAQAGSAPAGFDVQPTATGTCFPIDECNFCCEQPNGQLICTARLCA